MKRRMEEGERGAGDKPCTEELSSSLKGAIVGSVFILVFRDRVSLCSPGCPGTHSADQAGLELTDIFLPFPPSSEIKGVC
jgi:hypothetical protein